MLLFVEFYPLLDRQYDTVIIGIHIELEGLYKVLAMLILYIYKKKEEALEWGFFCNLCCRFRFRFRFRFLTADIKDHVRRSRMDFVLG